MAFQFYKKEIIKLPDGTDFEVLPITVEDMPEVLQVMGLQDEIKSLSKGKRKPSKKEILQLQSSKFFPSVWTVAQRIVKRHYDENKMKNIEELDKLPDEPMPITMALRIASKSIEISMNMDDDIKNFILPEKATKKS